MLFNKIFEHTSYQIQCHIEINIAQYVNMLYDRPNATRSRNIKSWLQKFYSRNHDLFHQCDSVGCRRLQCKHYDMFPRLPWGIRTLWDRIYMYLHSQRT